MADDITGKQTSNRRLTSSGKHPFPGLPLPERLKKRDEAQTATSTIDRNRWGAAIYQVSSCTLQAYDYNNRQDMDSRFKEEGKKRCSLACHNPPGSLEIVIRVCKQEEEWESVKAFVIPEERLGIEIFDSDLTIELRDQKICWLIELKSDMRPADVLVASKAMLRRLESVTSKMPANWFTYRNFAAQIPKTGAYFSDNTLYQNFPGGHTWKFTGALTSPEFLRCINVLGDTDAGSSQSQAERAIPKTANGKKAGRLAPKKSRRSKRVEERYMTTVEQLETLALATTEPALEPRAVGEASAELASPAEWEIEGLLDSRIRTGRMQYLVKWSGNWQPSWEPVENLSADSVRLFETNGPCQTSSPSQSQSSSPEDSGDSPYEPAVPKKRDPAKKGRGRIRDGQRQGSRQ